MRLVSMEGVPGQLQLMVDNPSDELRLLAALEEAKVLADELRGGATITSEELYTRLGMPEFRSAAGDAPMSVVAFKLLTPLLYPEYGANNSVSHPIDGEGYDYWTARPRGAMDPRDPALWRMRPVGGAEHILIGA
jgi:hypothetical protein